MISATMIKLSLGLAAAGLFTPALAHIEMTSPVPLNSKLDPAYTNPDYSMTSPLDPSGANFPCKGYNTPELVALGSKATLTAGQDLPVTLSAGATHNGGSCQFSLSYDNGATFGAIHDVIGGCPMTPSYAVPIPAGVPSGKNVLFAWTWFNHSGNREMYMNCAVVDVVGASAPFSTPGMFKANVGNCVTPEGIDLDFAAGVPGCDVPAAVTLTGSGGGDAPAAPPADPAAPAAPPADPAAPPAAPAAPPADPAAPPAAPAAPPADPAAPPAAPAAPPADPAAPPPAPAAARLAAARKAHKHQKGRAGAKRRMI